MFQNTIYKTASLYLECMCQPRSNVVYGVRIAAQPLKTHLTHYVYEVQLSTKRCSKKFYADLEGASLSDPQNGEKRLGNPVRMG